MSSIPVSERKPSKLEAINKLYNIRARITDELLISFGFSEKVLLSNIEKKASQIKNKEEYELYKKKLLELETDFYCWFITEERGAVLKYLRKTIGHTTAANSIYFQTKKEYKRRRKYWNRALTNINKLIQEIQYLAEVLPANLNRYSAIALELNSVRAMIKNLKSSDKRRFQTMQSKINK